MPIEKEKITKEMVMAAMKCKDADELVALAKTSGHEMTREEAEAYLEELEDYELDKEALQKVASGALLWDTYFRETSKSKG